MKTPPRKTARDSSRQRAVAPESPESNETFPRRTDPPGKAGLANEGRPGLGSRSRQPYPGQPGDAQLAARRSRRGNVAKHQRSSQEPNDRPLPREPQEQGTDTWEHESERSTGASGQMGL